MTEQGGEKLVDIGRWLYCGSAESIVHLVETNIAFGSGDHQDPPDVRDDRVGVFFVLKLFDPENHARAISQSGAFESEALARKAAAELCWGLMWEGEGS